MTEKEALERIENLVVAIGNGADGVAYAVIRAAIMVAAPQSGRSDSIRQIADNGPRSTIVESSAVVPTADNTTLDAITPWRCGTSDCVCNVNGACDCHNFTEPKPA